MDIQTIKEKIDTLGPDSDLLECVAIEKAIDDVADKAVKQELFDLYERKNNDNDKILRAAEEEEGEEEEVEEEESEEDANLSGDEDTFDHDKYASVPERVLGFQAWCKGRREKRNERLSAMFALIESAENGPSEEEFMKARARLGAVAKSQKEGAASAAAPE